MFIYYFVHVDLPLADAKEALLDLVSGIPGAADAAFRKGEAILKAGARSKIVAKRVEIFIGRPLTVNEELVIPLRWEATGPTDLFPVMEAELRLAAVDPVLSRVCLQGTYEPPLGALGRALDRAVLHRVAEATVKHFVDELADELVGNPRHGLKQALA